LSRQNQGIALGLGTAGVARRSAVAMEQAPELAMGRTAARIAGRRAVARAGALVGSQTIQQRGATTRIDAGVASVAGVAGRGARRLTTGVARMEAILEPGQTALSAAAVHWGTAAIDIHRGGHYRRRGRSRGRSFPFGSAHLCANPKRRGDKGDDQQSLHALISSSQRVNDLNRGLELG